MADGTRLAHLTESAQTFHDHMTKQETTNANVQKQLSDITDLLRNLTANQACLAPAPFPMGDSRNPHLDEHPPLIYSRDDRRLHGRQGSADQIGREDRYMDRYMHDRDDHDNTHHFGPNHWDYCDDRHYRVEEDSRTITTSHPFDWTFQNLTARIPSAGLIRQLSFLTTTRLHSTSALAWLPSTWKARRLPGSRMPRNPDNSQLGMPFYRLSSCVLAQCTMIPWRP